MVENTLQWWRWRNAWQTSWPTPALTQQGETTSLLVFFWFFFSSFSSLIVSSIVSSVVSSLSLFSLFSLFLLPSPPQQLTQSVTVYECYSVVKSDMLRFRQRLAVELYRHTVHVKDQDMKRCSPTSPRLQAKGCSLAGTLIKLGNYFIFQTEAPQLSIILTLFFLLDCQQLHRV